MNRVKRYWAGVIAGLLLISNLLLGFPADMLVNAWNRSKIVDKLYLSMQDESVVDNKRPALPRLTGTASAADFTMQTGYYIGNGSTQAISGVGFQPQLVVIKSHTNASQAIWKSSAMPANTTAFFGATANNTGTLITLNANGFSVANNAATNTANVRYTWTAFAGSDCTASGTFCVGTYAGNNSNPRLINTGFQPNFVMVKRSTNAVAANFRTSTMANNMGQYFTTTAQVTNGTLFTTLPSNGFNVGSTNNGNGNTYYYMAFKAVSGIMAVGSYSGNGSDNRNITGFGSGSTPDFAMVKNATSSTASNRNPVMSTTHHFGDHSSFFSSATANANNRIQALQDNGIQVGAQNQVNQSGATIYWAAWGGAASSPSGSGTFQMATGSYTGNGSSRTISGVGFNPDLVIIKGDTTQQGVFRTSLMAGNNTAYLASATANFTGGITSLGSGSFNLGTSATVNSSGVTYHWQAFGNAYKPTTRSGAADFMVGAYSGSSTDNRNITDIPWQPDMVTIKRSGASAGLWRSVANSGNQSSFFANTADGNNRVQALQSFGFQIGTNANVNSSNNLYNWFAFKAGDNFAVGSYSGSGGTQTITSPGFQPDLAWVKRSTNQYGVQRPATLAGNSTQHFANVANFANGITGLVCNGFSLTGTTAQTNASGGTYRYAAWRVPSSILSVDIVDTNGCPVSSPAVSMPASTVSFSCSNTVGILGSISQKLRVINTTANPSWSLSIAATNGAGELWRNGGNNQQFDFNESSGAPPGCSDGGDSDDKAGRLSFDPSSGSVTPKSGCTNTGVSLGSAAGFTEGSVDAITLISASGAPTNCYWDITGIGVGQYIPSEQPGDTYTINLTLTITAF